MKTTFSDHAETAHAWANAATPYGKNRSGNLYYTGRTLYSYGEHFPLAHDYGAAVVVNASDYSVTTRRHKSEALAAVRGRRVVSVPVVLGLDGSTRRDDVKRAHRANLAHLTQAVRDAVDLQRRARSRDYSGDIYSAAGELARYAEAFPVGNLIRQEAKRYAAAWRQWGGRDVNALHEPAAALAEIAAEYTDTPAPEAARTVARLREEAEARRRPSWQEQEYSRAGMAERREARALDEIERRFPVLADAWRAGDDEPRQFVSGAKLTPAAALALYGRRTGIYAARIVGGVIETTGSARVDIRHAAPVLRRLSETRREAMETGRTKASFYGSGPRVGPFEVREVRPDGSVQIGCHNFPAREAGLIAAALDTAPEPVAA